MKYTIEVTRVSFCTRDIEVEADSQEEAEEKALEEAPGLLFDDEVDAEYTIADN